MIYDGKIKVKESSVSFSPVLQLLYNLNTALISRGINIAWRKAVAREK
jgi:hypothetical protein